MLLGLLHLVVFVYALINILSSSIDITKKILWILVVGLFPVLGLIIYLLILRKS